MREPRQENKNDKNKNIEKKEHMKKEKRALLSDRQL